jgi:stage III sporulation protein AD
VKEGPDHERGIAALCTVGAVLALVLKQYKPELGILLAVSVCGAALVLLSGVFADLIGFLREMAQSSALSSEWLEPLLKTVGIAIISRVGSDLCRDSGESAMATLVDTAGSICAILVAVPLFQAVWEMLISLI